MKPIGGPGRNTGSVGPHIGMAVGVVEVAQDMVELPAGAHHLILRAPLTDPQAKCSILVLGVCLITGDASSLDDTVSLTYNHRCAVLHG
jgi:hypothetical protein